MYFGASANYEQEHALMYLPNKRVAEYRRRQIIYDHDQPFGGIHLIVRGRVQVSIADADCRSQAVVDIFSAEEFFGESGLLGVASRGERAVALENTSLMSWSSAEIEEQIERQPRLGLALIQMLVERCIDFEERLQSFALDKSPERVGRALLRFAHRLGVREEDGSVRIPPLSQQLISECIGTSREAVTFQMNDLRRQGIVRYSRKAINIFADALRQHLR